MSNLVIGIEGLVGAGKTSICRYIIENNENTVLERGFFCILAWKSILINLQIEYIITM